MLAVKSRRDTEMQLAKVHKDVSIIRVDSEINKEMKLISYIFVECRHLFVTVIRQC